MYVPMKEKYVEERVGCWMIFGEYENGNVDVSNGHGDIFCNLPRDAAEKIIELQNKFYQELVKILC